VRLSTLAVTDHDTIEGVAPAREAARHHDLEIVSGIEFSSDLDAHEVHILGLFVDDRGEELHAATRDSRRFRRQRAEEIVERLRSLDVSIEFSSVEKAAGRGSMGRPHIASALLHHGAVSTVDEAFGRYIGVGRPGFVPKPTLGAAAVIEVVHRAGGVAILAHPASSRLREAQILQLADLGVDVEALREAAASHRHITAATKDE
jgi:predicted metal-dependent phosphoesterase TrpH